MFQCYKGKGIVGALKIGKKRESCRGEGGREGERGEREREKREIVFATPTLGYPSISHLPKTTC